MKEIEDRHFGAHSIWDEFVQPANGHTIRARTIKPRKGSAQFIDITNFKISTTLVRRAQARANKLERVPKRRNREGIPKRRES